MTKRNKKLNITLLNDYQEQAALTNCYPFNMTGTLAMVLGLTEEAGEVAGKVSKCVRDNNAAFTKERTAAIREELGDVLWQVSQVSMRFGFTLSDIANSNIEKLAGRVRRNTIHGSGDER